MSYRQLSKKLHGLKQKTNFKLSFLKLNKFDRPIVLTLWEILPIMIFWKGRTLRVTKKSVHKKVDTFVSYPLVKKCVFVFSIFWRKMKGIYNGHCKHVRIYYWWAWYIFLTFFWKNCYTLKATIMSQNFKKSKNGL